MVTPIGQWFFQVLEKELTEDICKTPHLLISIRDVIKSLMDASSKFALNK